MLYAMRSKVPSSIISAHGTVLGRAVCIRPGKIVAVVKHVKITTLIGAAIQLRAESRGTAQLKWRLLSSLRIVHQISVRAGKKERQCEGEAVQCATFDLFPFRVVR